MKASEQHSAMRLLLMLYKVVLMLESMDDISYNVDIQLKAIQRYFLLVFFSHMYAVQGHSWNLDFIRNERLQSCDIPLAPLFRYSCKVTHE